MNNAFLNKLVSVDAFRRLSQMGLEVALESPVVHMGQCDGNFGGTLVKNVIKRIVANGGSVNYINMDSPYLYGLLACGLSDAQIAVELNEFMAAIKSEYPNMVFNEIEAMPKADGWPSSYDVKRWVSFREAQGIHFNVFILDYSLARARQQGIDVLADLRGWKSFLAQYGTKPRFFVNDNFGGASTQSDAQYYANALKWARLVRSGIGTVDWAIFESWYGNIPGTILLPTKNIPDSSAYSLTNLVLGGLTEFKRFYDSEFVLHYSACGNTLPDYGNGAGVCPASAPSAGRLHVPPSAGCVTKASYAKDFLSNSLDGPGWVGLCAKNGGDKLIISHNDDAPGTEPDYGSGKGACPIGFASRGHIHVGEGTSDSGVRGVDFLNNVIKRGWLGLCSKASYLIVAKDGCGGEPPESCPSGTSVSGFVHVGVSCSSGPTGYSYSGKSIKTGWMALCSKTA